MSIFFTEETQRRREIAEKTIFALRTFASLRLCGEEIPLSELEIPLRIEVTNILDHLSNRRKIFRQFAILYIGSKQVA